MKISASDCPHGYYFQAGDKVGNPTEIDSAKAEEIGECGRRCDKNKKCKSIEWSDSDKNCVLLTAESTDGPKWKDYRFCSKIIETYTYTIIQNVHLSICNGKLVSQP